jgi:hypothetical protein
MTDAERQRSLSTDMPPSSAAAAAATATTAGGGGATEAKSAAKKSRRVSVHWPEGEVASVLATNTAYDLLYSSVPVCLCLLILYLMMVVLKYYHPNHQDHQSHLYLRYEEQLRHQ